MKKAALLLCIAIASSGCGGVMAYRRMEMAEDEQKLLRMYRECVERHMGNPEAMQKNCEPIMAPLRVTVKKQ